MEDERIGVEQIEIPKLGFQKWYKSNAGKLFENTFVVIFLQNAKKPSFYYTKSSNLVFFL